MRTCSTSRLSASARLVECCCNGSHAPAFKVVGFEAGPFWDTERDWVSDEAGSHKLYWNDLRITGGEDPLALGANNSGTRRRRRLGALGIVYAALPSIGLRGLHARRRGCGLADHV